MIETGQDKKGIDMRRAAWVIVVSAALIISNWSLAYVAQHWHVVWILSWTVSLMFDGAAILCADLALQAARLGDSTFGPNSGLVVLAGLSSWLNSYHAQLAGDPWQARVLYAAPPVVAVALVEWQLRHDRRQALRDAGRIADPLPAWGGPMWVNKPASTYRAMRKVLRHRQREILAAAGVATRTAAAGPPHAEQIAGRRAGQPQSGTARVNHHARAVSRKSTSVSAGRLAQVRELIRADLRERPGEVSKRKSAGQYGISEYYAQEIISSERAAMNGTAA